MRLALIWGGIASLVLTAALLLAMPKNNPVGATVDGGGVPFILGSLSEGVQDFLLLLIIFAFFSCGTSVQGAGSRLAFSYARDGALPGSRFIGRVHPRFKTPVNALLAGVFVTMLFVLLVFPSPSHDVHIWFITYPANTNALVALVSFGVSGIYLSFLLTVIVAIVAAVYLGLMLVDVAYPSGLGSPRAFFNLDWITLTVVAIIALVGAAYF